MEIPSKPELIFGQYGLSKVQYLGAAVGRYKGPETCHWYEVTAGRVLYVDNRDKPPMLAYKDGQGASLFGEPSDA